MSDETIKENPEAIGETSPYIQIARGQHDHQNALMERTIRDRGRQNWMFFVLLAASVYSNVYLVMQPRHIPFIYNVDSNGTVVTRIPQRPEDISVDDPGRQAFIRKEVKAWVQNARIRSADRKVTARGIKEAILMAAGPALVNFTKDIKQEEVGKRITRESVEVLMPKNPLPLPGTNAWQAEWDEVISTTNNMELRRESWTGTFQIAAQANWVDELNPYGIRIVGKSWAPSGK